MGAIAPPEIGGLAWLADKPFWSASAAACVVFAQGILVNQFDHDYRLASDRTWLPGLFYVLVASAVPQFQFLSPALLAATFMPISLGKIFGTYKSQLAFSQVFDAAFWLAVGALIFPPMLWLVAAGFVGLSIVRSFGLREQLVFLSGAFVPFFLGWLWAFWHDAGDSFWANQFDALATGFFHLGAETQLQALTQWGLLGGLFLLILLSFGAVYRKKLIQTQKCLSILYWFLLVAGASLLAQSQPPMTHFLLLAPTAGLLLSLIFMGFGSRRRLAEILFLALLCAIFGLMFWPDLSVISSLWPG